MFSICSTGAKKSQDWVVQGDCLVRSVIALLRSEHFRAGERRRQDDGEVAFRVEDPDAFNGPWSAIKPARNRADVRGGLRLEQPAPVIIFRQTSRIFG
jgi:hypothetical protein